MEKINDKIKVKIKNNHNPNTTTGIEKVPKIWGCVISDYNEKIQNNNLT